MNRNDIKNIDIMDIYYIQYRKDRDQNLKKREKIMNHIDDY